MRKYASKIKTIVICGIIIAIILLGIGLFEIGLLKILGLQYTSTSALVIFFLIYLFSETPLSLIADSIPKALKTVGIIKSSKGYLPFVLDTGLAYILITVIDYFMENINISWYGALLFALISGIINIVVKEDDPEPPMINSKEYKDLHDKLENQ